MVLLGARWHRDLRVLAPIYSCPVGAVLAVSDVHAYLACDCGPKIETKAQAFGSEVAGSRDLFSGPFFMQIVPYASSTLAKIYRFCSPLGVRFEL